MPDGTLGGVAERTACVGPNAILQLKYPMERHLGHGVLEQVLDLCRVEMPTGERMIPEVAVGRVHHTLWQLFPLQAEPVSQAAGRATARYIQHHRIPRIARVALRVGPRTWAERRLASAIEAHAWTFCGSGAFGTHMEDGQIHFLIRHNPLADHGAQPPHLCHWHSAVFSELFSQLLGRPYTCREVSCCAMGAEVCHFIVSRAGDRQGAGMKA